LNVYTCSAADTVNFADVTCMEESALLDKVNHLVVEFFFLNTNFEGNNIETPLVSFIDTVLPVGL